MIRVLSFTVLIMIVAISYSTTVHAKTCSGAYKSALSACKSKFQHDAAKLADCNSRQKASHGKCLKTGTYTYRTSAPQTELTKK